MSHTVVARRGASRRYLRVNPSVSPIDPKLFRRNGMARRVALKDIAAVIQIIKEDGGVILTNFSSTEDVERVNADAAPYIQKIVDDV